MSSFIQERKDFHKGFDSLHTSDQYSLHAGLHSQALCLDTATLADSASRIEVQV